MSQKRLVLDFKGLVTAPGQLASAPGALLQAENVDFPAPGLAEKRKGLQAAANTFGGPCFAAVSTKQLGANVLFNANGALGSQLQYGDGASPTVVVTTPDGTNFSGNGVAQRMKAAVSLRNHYLTSIRAVGRLQSDYSFAWAGMPRSPGLHWRQQTTAQLVATGAWLPVNYSVAYRVVWVLKDVDGVEIVSAPSGRWVVSNVATTNGYAAATAGVHLSIRIPYQADTNATAITTSWTFRVYRSIAVDSTTAEPNDEMQLCYEASPSGAGIAAGYVEIDDTCPQSALGAYLYTNTVSGGDVTSGMVAPSSTSIGMAASNDGPPLAADVATFADCVFYANIVTRMRFQFSIIATGAGALNAGDVLTVDTTAYTATAGAPAGTTQFRVETTLGSVTRNLRQTAMNLVAAINSSHPTITAAYIGSDASPGTIGAILLERRRSDNSTAFSVTTTGVTTAYLPTLDGTRASRQDTWGNGLAVSKPFQGDAVPPANYTRVGRNDAVIQRIIPLRDALYVFTDDGIYWVRGTQPADFSVEAFDLTFRVLSRDSVVSTGDAIYAWGREGVAKIDNGGVEYLDLPIRNYVQQAQKGLAGAVTLTAFAQRSFAVAYPIQRRVVFFFPSGNEVDGLSCNRALVYHVSTGAWSTYRFDNDAPGTNGKLSGVVRWSDELLVAGEYPAVTNSYLYIERSAGTVADYQDAWDDGTTKGITTTLQWLAVTPEPSETNHWSELQVYLTPNAANSALTPPSQLQVNVTSEHGGTVGSTALTINSSDYAATRLMLTPTVGIAARQTVTVTHINASEYFASSGFGLLYRPISSFVVR